jgi:hypothetical protein
MTPQERKVIYEKVLHKLITKVDYYGDFFVCNELADLEPDEQFPEFHKQRPKNRNYVWWGLNEQGHSARIIALLEAIKLCK